MQASVQIVFHVNMTKYYSTLYIVTFSCVVNEMLYKHMCVMARV